MIQRKHFRTGPGGSAQGVLAAANNLALPFAPAGSDSGHIQQKPANRGVEVGAETLRLPCRKTAI